MAASELAEVLSEALPLAQDSHDLDDFFFVKDLVNDGVS
jgi:hypothetical protein